MSRSKEKLEVRGLRFEDKKPYDFDRNQNRSVLSKKEQPNTTEKKRENLNRSNVYDSGANNLVLFS